MGRGNRPRNQNCRRLSLFDPTGNIGLTPEESICESKSSLAAISRVIFCVAGKVQAQIGDGWTEESRFRDNLL